MARAKSLRAQIRELHGDDAEILEARPIRERRRSTYVIDAEPDPLAAWPWWLKAELFVLAFVCLSALLLASIAGAVFSLGVLWTLFGSH